MSSLSGKFVEISPASEVGWDVSFISLIIGEDLWSRPVVGTTWTSLIMLAVDGTVHRIPVLTKRLGGLKAGEEIRSSQGDFKFRLVFCGPSIRVGKRG